MALQGAPQIPNAPNKPHQYALYGIPLSSSIHKSAVHTTAVTMLSRTEPTKTVCVLQPPTTKYRAELHPSMKLTASDCEARAHKNNPRDSTEKKCLWEYTICVTPKGRVSDRWWLKLCFQAPKPRAHTHSDWKSSLHQPEKLQPTALMLQSNARWSRIQSVLRVGLQSPLRQTPAAS